MPSFGKGSKIARLTVYGNIAAGSKAFARKKHNAAILEPLGFFVYACHGEAKAWAKRNIPTIKQQDTLHKTRSRYVFLFCAQRGENHPFMPQMRGKA